MRDGSAGDGPAARAEARAAAERRRRLAEVFGDVLPESTSDDRDHGSSAREDRGEGARDRWFRDQVPPHHG